MSYIPRLQTQYAEEIIPSLTERFEYKSVMQVPPRRQDMFEPRAWKSHCG